jgi:hypothetical protein
MPDGRKYQRGVADKKGQQNNEGKAGQSQSDKDGKKSGALRKPNAPGRPGNISSGRPTVGSQKSKGGSRGSSTSKAGR